LPVFVEFLSFLNENGLKSVIFQFFPEIDISTFLLQNPYP